MKREIGGYLEFEQFHGDLYHPEAIALNSGRACLAYLVELRRIKAIWVPDLMCDSVYDLLAHLGVDVYRYRIGENLVPDFDSMKMSSEDYLLLMDYYGQLTPEDVHCASQISNGRLIVDETQGFFRAPWQGADTFYTCRKWFGVSDGAYLYTRDGSELPRELERDESAARMAFILGRYEREASRFLDAARANDAMFTQEPIKEMSALTENTLRGVDYPRVVDARQKNWKTLECSLSSSNLLDVRIPDVPFMYPYLVHEAGDMRRMLAAQGIYIPQLWPNVVAKEEDDESVVAPLLAQNILPLPLDQRYGRDEMEYVVKMVTKCLG